MEASICIIYAWHCGRRRPSASTRVLAQPAMGKLRGSITGGLHAKGGQGANAGPGPSPTRRHSTYRCHLCLLPVLVSFHRFRAVYLLGSSRAGGERVRAPPAGCGRPLSRSFLSFLFFCCCFFLFYLDVRTREYVL